MKLITLLFLLWIFLCGCSSTYTVRSTEAEDAFSYEQMNEKLKGQDATIELRDGWKMYAKEVQIANDTISVVDVRSEIKSKVSIVKLNKIVIKNHFLGVLESVGLGLLAVGGIAGLGWIISSNIYVPFVALFLGIPVCTLVGLITGLSIGHRYIYEFPMEQPKDSLRNINSH